MPTHTEKEFQRWFISEKLYFYSYLFKINITNTKSVKHFASIYLFIIIFRFHQKTIDFIFQISTDQITFFVNFNEKKGELYVQKDIIYFLFLILAEQNVILMMYTKICFLKRLDSAKKLIGRHKKIQLLRFSFQNNFL